MFGISTVHELDGPGFKPQWRQEIFIFSVFGPGPTQLPVQWLSGLFVGVNWLGRGIDHSPRFSAKVENGSIYDSTSLMILHWRVTG